MSHTRHVLASVAALSVLLGACGGQDRAGDLEPGAESDGAVDGTVEGTDGDQARGGTDDEQIAAATADLAATEGVDEAEIDVVTFERVTWPDGSLGCPDPDAMYTQALVPGYRIVLAMEGTEVHYHGAEGAAPARCDDPSPPAESGS